MLNIVINNFERIKDSIDYVACGTPLSNNYYFGRKFGESV
jgi:hypothetical protein